MSGRVFALTPPRAHTEALVLIAALGAQFAADCAGALIEGERNMALKII